VCKLDARAVHLPPRPCGEARPFFVGPNGASIFDTLDAVSDKRSSARPVGAAERIQRVRPHCVQSRLTPRWTGVSARTHRTGRGRRRCRWWRDGVFRTGVHGNHGLYRGLRAEGEIDPMPTARRPCLHDVMRRFKRARVHAGWVRRRHEGDKGAEGVAAAWWRSPACSTAGPALPATAASETAVTPCGGRVWAAAGSTGAAGRTRTHAQASPRTQTQSCARMRTCKRIRVQTTRPHAQNTHACNHTLRTSTNARTDAALARTQANKPASGVLNIPSEEFSKNWKLPPDFESANWLWKARLASFATYYSRRPRV
jgi:hypothetical protein